MEKCPVCGAPPSGEAPRHYACGSYFAPGGELSYRTATCERDALACQLETIAAQLAEVTAERDRLRELLDALIEEHAPHKFGPCVCDLCKEYAALAQPAAAQPTEGE